MCIFHYDDIAESLLDPDLHSITWVHAPYTVKELLEMMYEGRN